MILFKKNKVFLHSDSIMMPCFFFLFFFLRCLALPGLLNVYISLLVSKIYKNRSAAALFNKCRIQCLILAVPKVPNL